MCFEENGIKMQGRGYAHGLRLVLLSLLILLNLCIPAFAQKNSGGQMYDRGAVVKSIKTGSKMSGYFVKVDAKKKIAYFYTDKKLTDQAGEYNLGEQFWIDWDEEKMDPLKVDLKAFYKKINLSKTVLMRTQDGTHLANVTVVKASRPEKTEAQIQKEKDAARKSGYDAGFVSAGRTLPKSHADYADEWYAGYDEGSAEVKRQVAEKARQAAETAKKDGYDTGLSGKSGTVPKKYSANSSDWKSGYSEGAAERKRLSDVAYNAGYEDGLKGASKSPVVPSDYKAYSDSYKSGYTKGWNEMLVKKQEEEKARIAEEKAKEEERAKEEARIAEETRIAEEKERERNASQETPATSTGSTNSTSSVQPTGTSSSTSTASASTSTSTTSTSAYVPDAQVSENFVFTARKHPTVVSYDKLDVQVQKIKCPISMTPEEAAKKIIAPAKTDMEKARALFTWIACNVVYDYSFKKESYTAAGTWKNRTGVCEGYTHLYIQMAKAVGLNAEYISGYAKNTADYNPGNPLEKHGWGVVHINGKHVLFEVTWAAVSKLNEPSTFNGDWFDVDPYLFIFSHFPQDLSLTYIADKSMDLGQFYEYFKKLPTAHPGLARLGVDGKELYDFFKVNPDAWVPKCYNEFYADRGVKINKLPLTRTLAGNKTYAFNFTIPKGVAMTLGDQPLVSGKDLSYTPSSTSQAGAILKFGVQSGIVYSTEFNLIENLSDSSYFKAQNMSKAQFNMADGSKNDNVASGKPKVLVFIDGSKDYLYSTLSLLAIYSNKFNDVDLFFVDAGDKNGSSVKNSVKGAAESAGVSQYVALQDASENRALVQKYMTQAGLSSSTVHLPVAVFIDSSNKLQFVDAFRAVPDAYSRVEQIAKATGTKSFNTSSFNVPNTNKAELPAMGGGSVNNQAAGKAKVLVSMPFLCGDKDSERLAKEIMAASAQFKNIDLVITDSKFACDRMSATKQFNTMLRYSLGESYDQAFADKVFAASEDVIGLGGEDYYWGAAGFNGRDLYSSAQIFYIDSANHFRWLDCIPGLTVSSIISRVSEIERTVVRQASSSSANANSYGLPYDSKAVFNGKEIEFDASSYFNSGIMGTPKDNYIYFYDAGRGPYGCYDWKEQCWLWVTSDRIKETEIDFTKFYTKIDLSKTKLNRDFTGAPLGPQVNEAKSEPVSQIPASALNDYGLPYDPDAVHIELPAGKRNLGSIAIMKSTKNPEWVSVQSMMTGGWYTYDLKNQCWESARGLSSDALDISILYEKIDLSKTELMRDKQGNPCGGWKNTSIKFMNASDAERYANLEKEAAKSKITTGYKNSYGLIYDYDYRMPSQSIVFMEKGITGSANNSTKLITFKNRNGDILGTYNYDQQVWASRKSDFSMTDVELAMFYTAIELRATTLNRDYSGTSIIP